MKKGHPSSNILVTTSTFPRWSGDTEPPFVLELCRRLTAYFKVHVLAPRAPGSYSDMDFYGMRVIRYPYFLSRWENLTYHGGILANLKKNPARYSLIPFFILFQTVAILRLIRQIKFDLIHAHWIIPQGMCAVIANQLRRSSGVPVLCTSHGADLYGIQSKPLTDIKRFALNRSSALTTVSRKMQDDVRNLNIDLNNIQVIPMGVDLHGQFIPPAKRKGAHSILFVGRVVEKKGLRYLIEAMPTILNALPDATLVVAGDGQELNVLKDHAAKIGVKEHIQFLGAVTNEELPFLYQASDVVVFPSIVAAGGDREGFGLVLVEALGCECAVVATNLPATRDIIQDGETAIIVKQKDDQQIAEEVIKLLINPELRAKLGKKGRQYVLKRYDWSIIAERYRNLIESIIKK